MSPSLVDIKEAMEKAVAFEDIAGWSMSEPFADCIFIYSAPFPEASFDLLTG